MSLLLALAPGIVAILGFVVWRWRRGIEAADTPEAKLAAADECLARQVVKAQEATSERKRDEARNEINMDLDADLRALGVRGGGNGVRANEDAGGGGGSGGGAGQVG